MAWFDSIPALTPTAAWDAKTFSPTQLLDRVGTNNLTFSGAESQPLYYHSFRGTSSRLLWRLDSAVNLPAECVLAGFMSHDGASIMFYEQEGQSSRFIENELNYMAQYSNINGLNAVNEAPSTNEFAFVALVKGAFGARFYWNMQWRGAVFLADYVGAAIRGVGWSADGSGYNLDQNDKFTAAGVWSGTATLQDLQALETAARAELAGPPINNFSGLLVRGGLAANDLAYTLPRPTNFSSKINAGWKIIYNTGSASIEGVTTIENVPGARQVRLYDKLTGQLLQQTFSNATGQYAFNGVDGTREYFVVAHDHLRVYNAVVQDMLTP